MTLRYQQPTEVKTAPLAFFFLALYVISVLIRPHEFSEASADYQFIRFFAVSSLILTIIAFRPIKITPQLVMLLLMLPVIMISAFLNGWGTGGILQAGRLLTSSIVPFFLFSNLLCTAGRQKALMLISIVAAFAMVYNGHIQQASFDGVSGVGIGGSTSVEREEMRITYLGFFNDPNDVGMFLTMNIPFAVFFLTRSNAFVLKLLSFGALLVLVYGIYMTGSRGTILGCTGIVVTYLMIKRASTQLIIFLAIAAPFAATLIASLGGLAAGEGSVDGRLDAWYVGTQMLLENPIFGIAMGNFADQHGLVAHNSYIHVAAELGFLGYSLWGGILIANMLASFAVVRLRYGKHRQLATESESPTTLDELRLNEALFYSMIGFMITTFFLSRSYVLTMYLFLGMQTASLLRLSNFLPSIRDYFTLKSIVKASAVAWGIIVVVYIALKISL